MLPGSRVPRKKIIASERNIEKLNVRMEHAVRINFLDGIRQFKKKLAKISLDKAFNRGNYAAVRELFPWKDMGAHLDKAAETLADTTSEAVKHTVEAIESPHNVNYLMDRRNPRLAQALEDRRKMQLHNLTRPSMDAIHDIIAENRSKGISAHQIARKVRQQLKDSFGLNKRQGDALANYRAGLEGLHSPSTIESMVKIRSEEMLEYRAKMIAVTETRVAANRAQLAAWHAMVQDGVLDPLQKRKWVLGAKDACDAVCKPMAGKVVGLNEPWILPGGREAMVVSESHPNCRCSQSLVLTSDADLRTDADG